MNTPTLSGPGADARVFKSVATSFLLLLACALARPLGAAEQEDPRDFLMMKLYEATMKVVDQRMEMTTSSPTPTPGSGSPTIGYTPMPQNYGCGRWLEIKRATNSASNVVVTIHNTVPALNYTLWTKTVLASTQAWTWETNVNGTSGQNWTAVTVPMNQRPQLFFFAGAGGFGTNASFRGLDFTNSTALVPDTMGAVGPEHFVELLNAQVGFAAVAVYEKCSRTLVQLVTNTQFFAVQANGTNYPTDRAVDPTILYDHQSQRWLALAMDTGVAGSRNLILAVSQTSSPLDLLTNWTKFLLSVDETDSHEDFPRLGLDANGVYVTMLRLATIGGQDVVVRNLVMAIHKPSLYSGTLVATTWTIGTNELDVGRIGTIHPVVNFDAAPRGGYAWFVAKQKWEATNTYLGGALRYKRLQWSGTNVSWADTNWVFVPNSPTYRDYFDLDEGSVGAPQTNSPHAIDLHRTGSRLMSAVMRDGALWTGQHIGLSGTNGTYSGNETGTNVDRSAVQWIKLSTDTNGQFLAVTNGRIYDPSSSNPYFYYFPSLMVNKVGDMVVGFSGSKGTEYIGAYYSWQAADGTTPNQPLLLQAGKGAFDGSLWGDYSATTLDPTDGLTFWTVQEYAGDSEIRPWMTWISEIIPSPSNP